MAERIAVFLPNFVGDTVLATPCLRALRKRFRDAQITFVGKSACLKVLEGTRWSDALLPYDRRSKNPQQRGWSVARTLRRQRPDLAIYLNSSPHSALVGFLAGARRRVGYNRNGRGVLLTDRLRVPPLPAGKPPWSALDYFLDLAYAAGCDVEERRLELAIEPSDLRHAERVWCELGFEPHQEVVMFNCASANGTSRHWPDVHYLELASMLVRDANRSVLILCGPGERELAARLEQIASHPRIRSMAKQDMGFGLAKACLLKGQVFVTPDNGPRHIAAAFHIPTVLLAGPIDPRANANGNPHEVSLSTDLGCQPCGKLECPLGQNQCMQELHPNRVYRVVRSMLEQSRSKVA